MRLINLSILDPVGPLECPFQLLAAQLPVAVLVHCVDELNDLQLGRLVGVADVLKRALDEEVDLVAV